MIDLGPPVSSSVKLDITPLLDVVFILLIFFVVSSVFAVQGMELDLPKAGSTQSVSGKLHKIKINKEGSLFFDTVPISLRELGYKLAAIKDSSKNRPLGRIVLESSPKTRVGLFISVVDAVRTAGFDDLVIATLQPDLSREQ